MTDCKCIKERDINELKEKIHSIEKSDIAKEKDMESFKEALDRLNEMLEKVNVTLEKLSNEPVEKYKKIWSYTIGGAIGAIVAFIMGLILQ